jgi:hypothetical protein
MYSSGGPGGGRGRGGSKDMTVTPCRHTMGLNYILSLSSLSLFIFLFLLQVACGLLSILSSYTFLFYPIHVLLPSS